jgi:hypothetical protein
MFRYSLKRCIADRQLKSPTRQEFRVGEYRRRNLLTNSERLPIS